MHTKYNKLLKDDPDMRRIYELLATAGIWRAFMNFYGDDGVFDYHRDHHHLSTNSNCNCMPEFGAAKEKNTRHCHKAAPGKISFEACNWHLFMRELIIPKCYTAWVMGIDGRGVTMMVQHKAERGPDVDGWDLGLVIDCTKEQHKCLQKLVVLHLAKDRLSNRPHLGE
jgi:hypothetical protein